MGLGFLAGFGLATLGLIAVAALIGWGALLYSSIEGLSGRETWQDSGTAMITLYFGIIAYIGAIVFLSIAA